MKLSGVILAGGVSSRFCFNKIKIRVEKIPLFVDQVFKLSFFCSEILICTSKKNYSTVKKEIGKIDDYYKYYCSLKEIKKVPPIKILLDEENLNSLRNIGPIGGLYSGLKSASNFYCLVVAFDMPFISYNILSLLVGSIGYKSTEKYGGKYDNTLDFKKNIEKRDAVIIKTRKGFEVLCGIYSKNCLEIVKKNIKQRNYKISNIFKDLKVKIILEDELIKSGVSDLSFFNINTLANYGNFIKIWNKGGLGNGPSDINSRFRKKWKNFFYREFSS